MRKLAYVICVMLAFGAGAVATKLLTVYFRKEPPPQSAPEPKSEAKTEAVAPAPAGFALKPGRYSFGKLFEGESRSVELTLERPGDKALRMGRLYSPCPCIRVEAAPQFVEAGKPAKITVNLHSLTLEGKKTFPVYIELLDPEKGVVRGDVDVEVERVPARVMLTPETFHFGSVTADKTATVKLTNLTKRPLRIEELASTLAGSSVEMKGPKLLAPGEAGELVLSLSAKDLPAGPIKAEVTLKTDSPLHAAIRIPVDGTVAK